MIQDDVAWLKILKVGMWRTKQAEIIQLITQ